VVFGLIVLSAAAAVAAYVVFLITRR